jgi:hypothetical protein
MKSPMSDPLLSQMSQIAREDVLADARWAAFASGALPEAEKADLLAKARAAGLDEATIEALGPRAEAFDERLADAALAAMLGGAAGERASGQSGGDAGERASGQSGGDAGERASGRSGGRPRDGLAPPADVTANDNGRPGAAARRKPIGPRLLGAATAVLAAAAAAFLFLRPAAFPAYSMEIEGGSKKQRSSPGDAGEVVALETSNRLVITLRPDRPVPRKVAARAYLRRPGETVQLDVPVEIADSGAVRIASPAGDLLRGARSGAWDLCVDLGAAEALRAGGEPAATMCRPIEWAGASPER